MLDSCAFSHLNTQSSPAYVPFIFDLTNRFQQLGDRHISTIQRFPHQHRPPVAFTSAVFQNIQSIRGHEKPCIDGQLALRHEQKIVGLLTLRDDSHSGAIVGKLCLGPITDTFWHRVRTTTQPHSFFLPNRSFLILDEMPVHSMLLCWLDAEQEQNRACYITLLLEQRF